MRISECHCSTIPLEILFSLQRLPAEIKRLNTQLHAELQSLVSHVKSIFMHKKVPISTFANQSPSNGSSELCKLKLENHRNSLGQVNWYVCLLSLISGLISVQNGWKKKIAVLMPEVGFNLNASASFFFTVIKTNTLQDWKLLGLYP